MGRRRVGWFASVGWIVASTVWLTTGCESASGSADAGESTDSTSSTAAAPLPSCAKANLADCLMSAPAGSKPWLKPFTPNGPVTEDQYVSHLFKAAAQTYETARLNAEAMRSIAQSAGAQRKPLSLPGTTSSVVSFYQPALDNDGNVSATVQTRAGPALLQFFFYSPARLDQATLDTWVRQQISTLGG
jgi:hypothetical protein